MVDGTATGQKKGVGGFLACRLLNQSLRTGSLFSATPYGYNNTVSLYGTMAETGAMFASASDPIQERCLTNLSAGASVITAGLTDIKLNSLNGLKHNTAEHRTPVNKFSPKAAPGGGQSILGDHSKS
jgi:hypothetical protein